MSMTETPLDSTELRSNRGDAASFALPGSPKGLGLAPFPYKGVDTLRARYHELPRWIVVVYKKINCAGNVSSMLIFANPVTERKPDTDSGFANAPELLSSTGYPTVQGV
jgi:hypothetical protein